jgi:ABC-type Zn uptake system ZnuABC Zn-binding protein ZnuA
MKRLILPFLASIAFFSVGASADQLKVVTTLATYADIAKTVGGDFVDTSYVASPRFNPHFIEPRPGDVLRVKRCDLFIHSGLDLEAWRGPLLDAAGRADIREGGEHQLDLSAEIPLLEVPNGQVSRAEGDIHIFGNPHYWIDPRNGVRIAHEIALKLSALDPAHAAQFEANRAKFAADVQAKMNEWQRAAAPHKGAELIGYHNEWVYLMEFLGLQMKQFLEPKPGIPPTPRQLEFLTGYIKEHRIRAIIQPSYYPREAADSVAAATGAKVLLLAQNVGETSAASNYLAMLDADIGAIMGALQ